MQHLVLVLAALCLAFAVLAAAGATPASAPSRQTTARAALYAALLAASRGTGAAHPPAFQWPLPPNLPRRLWTPARPATPAARPQTTGASPLDALRAHVAQIHRAFFPPAVRGDALRDLDARVLLEPLTLDEFVRDWETALAERPIADRIVLECHLLAALGRSLQVEKPGE